MLPLLLTTVWSKLQTLWERGLWLNSIISCLFHTCTDRVPTTCLLKCQKFILLKFWKTNVHTQYHWAKVKMLSGSSQESVHLLLALSCGIPWFIVPSPQSLLPWPNRLFLFCLWSNIPLLPSFKDSWSCWIYYHLDSYLKTSKDVFSYINIHRYKGREPGSLWSMTWGAYHTLPKHSAQTV
jgi:hypothetical protein